MQMDIEQDARDLRRGVVINMLGYLIKVAHPVLLVVVVRLYGAERFGIFSVAMAALLFVMRICLMGLDKGILWWVPRQEEENERKGLKAAFFFTGLSSLLAAVLIMFFLAPLVAQWSSNPESVAGLKIMAAGLVPMTLMEMFIHASLGKRRMEAQIFIREGMLSVTMVLAAIMLFFFGLVETGLALAFVMSYCVSLAGAVLVFRRNFRNSAWKKDSLMPPVEVLRYSFPMWISELANSFLLRMDMYIVAAMTDPRTLGIYAAVVQVGNVIKSVRRSFDPIVTSIFSQIGARHDAGRLKAGFSYATVLVIATQMPIYAFLVAFAGWLMPLFGSGFEQGSTAVLILCAFWIINGAVGLNGIILNGYGRSDLTLVNVLVTIAVEAVLLMVLVPSYGINGAAFAVGMAFTVQNIIQAVQARIVTHAWNYSRNVLSIIKLGFLSGGAMTLAWILLSAAGRYVNIVSFFLFMIVYCSGVLIFYRRGMLGRGGC